jgi:predicted ferric reductase
VSVRVDRRWVADQRSNVVARHVRVCVPSISHLWHPFSVFSPPHQRDRLNFIFRSYGSFTQSLAERLSAVALGDEDEAGCSTEKYPLILIDGIYDIPDRMRQALDHDIVCIVAGGIGIVSYLDMLLQLHSMQTTGQLKKVVLHWVCRDEGLIEHVAETHFRKLDRGEQETSSSSWMDVQIVIHHTSSK